MTRSPTSFLQKKKHPTQRAVTCCPSSSLSFPCLLPRRRHPRCSPLLGGTTGTGAIVVAREQIRPRLPRIIYRCATIFSAQAPNGKAGGASRRPQRRSIRRAMAVGPLSIVHERGMTLLQLFTATSQRAPMLLVAQPLTLTPSCLAARRRGSQAMCVGDALSCSTVVSMLRWYVCASFANQFNAYS